MLCFTTSAVQQQTPGPKQFYQNLASALSITAHGMDEQEIYLYFVQPDGGFRLRSWAAY
jgi:hypothetical protein